MIKVQIQTDNAAFEGAQKNEEIARILDVMAKKMSDDEFNVGKLYRYNGSAVEQCAETDESLPRLSGNWFVAEMNTGNAAFEDAGKGNECARIMREAAKRVRAGETEFNLRDYNGNTVGKVKEVMEQEKSAVHAYASGSGALSFVRRNNEGNPVQPSPQAEECIAYVRDKIEAGQGAWKRSEWVIVNQGPLDRENHEQFEAVRKVERVGDNALKMNEHVYSYDPTQVKGHVIPKFTFELAGRVMEIEGTGNNGALGYFLKNEALLSNPARVVWDSSRERLKTEMASDSQGNRAGTRAFTAGDMRPDIRGKLLEQKAVSLEDAELERVFEGVALPQFCIREARKARVAGVTIDDIREFENVKNEIGEKEGMESLYVAFAKAGVAMDHHETDLYVNVTPETKAILANFSLQQTNATTFKSNIDGALMYDIPFAYEPAWAKKLGGTAFVDMKIADSGRHLGKVVDIAHGHAVQNVGRGQLVIHDLKQLSQKPEVGNVMDVNYVEKMGEVKIVEQSKGVER